MTKPAKKSTPATGLSLYFANECTHCGGESKSVKREFSDQAWAALLSWGEIETKAVDQPICQDCYDDLRAVLVDRVDEIKSVPTSEPRGRKIAS